MSIPINYGMNTKTFSIPLKSGKFNYSLGSVIRETVFKHANAITGIVFRFDMSSTGLYTDEKGMPLVPAATMRNSWLNLYDLKGQVLLGNHNLQTLSTDYVTRDSYGNLITPSFVNWKKSEIFISPNTNIITGQQLEFTIWYTTDCTKSYPTNIAFNTGPYNALRRRTVEVHAALSGASSAFFNFGANELPSCAEIVGVRFLRFEYENKEGVMSVQLSKPTNPLAPPPPPKAGAMNCSFLQLKNLKSGYHSLLDNVPVTDLKAINHIGKDYFPIERTKAEEVDWANSGFLVSALGQMNDNVIFSLMFYYY
ncbi:MAG: hypothetical protein ACRBFS_19380 [Aureispira sp.]